MSTTMKPGGPPVSANRLGPVSIPAKTNSAHPTMGAVTSRAPLRVLLQQESGPALAELRDACYARHQPATLDEQFIVDHLTATLWRWRRSLDMEAAHWQHEIDKSHDELHKNYATIDALTESALAFSHLEDHRHTFNNLTRYQTSLSREIDRTLQRLRTLRAHHPYVEIPHEINEVQTEAPPRAA